LAPIPLMLPTFANPEWLWCLLLLPPLAGLRVWSHLRARRGATGLVSPRLTKDLVIGARQWSRWVVFSLQLAALGMLLIALARPQWGFEVAEEESESRNVVIAIDTSRSMLANDLTPDRLTRAKLAAEDIVSALPEDRIALLAFAGKAFVQAPLTLDHDAIIESIQQFDTELIPRGGSNLTKAAELAVELLEKVESKESALIIFSDGEALEGGEELASVVEDAEKVGLTVVAIGVGTDSGSIIPEPDENGDPQPGVFVTDDQGAVVRTRLDAAALQEFSRTLGGGAYLDLGSSPAVSRAVTDALKQIDATRGVSKTSRRPIDRFVWPLYFALFLFVAAWLLPGTSRLIERLLSATRKAPQKASVRAVAAPSAQVSSAVLAFLALTGVNTQAGIGEIESPGYEAYRKQKFPEAIAAYRREIETAESAKQRAWLNLGLGSAAYQTGDYALAKEAFGRTLAEGDKSLNERAHYNLANTLFRNGEALLRESAHPKNPALAKDDATKAAIAAQWQAAQEHYRAALDLDGSDANARHNLSVVDKRLELLNQPPPPQEEEQKQDQQDQDQQKQDQQQQQQEQQGQGSPQQPPPGDQPPPEKPGQPQDQPAGDPKDQPGDQPPPDQPKDPGQQPPGKPEPQQPPDEPTPDGDLEGKPNQPEGNPQAPQPAEAEVNPETGFSPEEARQRLRTLADEDKDVRPPIKMPIQAEKFKNW
jgi:Ca-activated chloride channel family protein